MWGIERSPLRPEQARAQLRGAGVEARLLEGDLLDLPPLAERFELISMTAVLHWLYPDEERLFRWVARHLEAQGVFLFTSHHPFAEDGLGGEDDLVAQALVEMGLAAPERVAALYAEAGLLPMGTRTRGREALRERVERHFRVDSIVSRPAALRVADSASTSVSTPPPSAPISHRWCRRRAWRNSSSASGGSPSGACRPTDRSAKSRSASGAAGAGGRGITLCAIGLPRG
ncbi:class I SAM-dependent methyltransferase [Pseudomonas aeruginosa]|nr:class I SAM-dependent methyltransferase [Pseudomonas aeruginosa]